MSEIGVEFGFEFKPRDHEVHQVMPTGKHHIAGQGLHIVEKGLATGEHLAKQGVLLITPLQHRMERKGEQVQAEHRGREILLAVAEVMFEMVALGLEDVVVFVFNLPPSTAGLGHFGHVCHTETVIGDKGVVVELCGRFGIDYGHLDPIDRERVLTVLQQDLIDEAIDGHFRQTPFPTPLFTLGDGTLGLPKGQAFIQLGMRIRLTHQDKVETLVERQRTKRLLAVEIIAQQGHVMRHQCRRMLCNPTFACSLLTVLFPMTILRHDVFGGEGDDLCVSRADDDRGNRRMVIQGLTVGKLTRETVSTMECLGGKVLRAIKCAMGLTMAAVQGVQRPRKRRVGNSLAQSDRGACGFDCRKGSARRRRGSERYRVPAGG